MRGAEEVSVDKERASGRGTGMKEQNSLGLGLLAHESGGGQEHSS